MENKTIKYIMGIAVISVWGLLTFRIYARYFPDEEIIIPFSSQEPEYNEMPVQDTFVIAVDYRDPFLGNQFKPTIQVSNNNGQINKRKEPPRKQPIKEQPLVFPEIKYKGSVGETSGDNKTALVSIDNQFMSWKIGEVYNGLNLLKIYPDSIQIRLEKEEKTILRER